MESEFKNYLQTLGLILDTIQSYVDKNQIRNSETHKLFYDLQMKFESLSELIYHQYNYHDYQTAIKITKELGYVSIAKISRTLNIRYNQSFEMVEEMERTGIIAKPNRKGLWVYIKSK